ncbi:hypothetical protein FKM82_016012 [Ascaphus truei]
MNKKWCDAGETLNERGTRVVSLGTEPPKSSQPPRPPYAGLEQADKHLALPTDCKCRTFHRNHAVCSDSTDTCYSCTKSSVSPAPNMGVCDSSNTSGVRLPSL